mmetsp:Transcript_29007/g.67861  ORF Transcript_29007/g.67861 Transcript_29007/m.67861 type:complete len:385 (+) Transcript_29007:977-2131(+)
MLLFFPCPIKKLSGFMSLCTTPFWCIAWTRVSSWSASMSTVFRVKRLAQRSKRSSKELPSKSITSIRDVSSSPVPLSFGNPLSPANCLYTRASYMSCGTFTLLLSILTATVSPVWMSTAEWITPNEPLPSTFPRRYLVHTILSCSPSDAALDAVTSCDASVLLFCSFPLPVGLCEKLPPWSRREDPSPTRLLLLSKCSDFSCSALPPSFSFRRAEPGFGDAFFASSWLTLLASLFALSSSCATSIESLNCFPNGVACPLLAVALPLFPLMVLSALLTSPTFTNWLLSVTAYSADVFSGPGIALRACGRGRQGYPHPPLQREALPMVAPRAPFPSPRDLFLPLSPPPAERSPKRPHSCRKQPFLCQQGQGLPMSDPSLWGVDTGT